MKNLTRYSLFSQNTARKAEMTSDIFSKICGQEWSQSISEMKNFRVLVDKEINMSHEYVLTAKKANSIMGCIKRGMDRKAKEVIVPLCSALMMLHQE